MSANLAATTAAQRRRPHELASAAAGRHPERGAPALPGLDGGCGVGGAVAEMVVARLRAPATRPGALRDALNRRPRRDRQVRVSKSTERGVTRTTLGALDGDARVEELARMLGGTSITARTRDHAREMLESALQRPAARGTRRSTAASTGGGSSRARSGRAV
jgi:DNA repair protein RecN (Recombination protein N)